MDFHRSLPDVCLPALEVPEKKLDNYFAVDRFLASLNWKRAADDAK
jgi:hypothetical protein